MQQLTRMTLFLTFLALAALPAAQAAEYGLSIDVQQVEGGVYELAAEVRELGSDRLVAAPRVQFTNGSPAETVTAVPDSETRVRLEARVSEDGSTLVYSLAVDEGDTPAARQTAAVALR